MLRRFKPSRARLEFEAVKGLAKDNFNEGFLILGLMAYFSLCVLATCILGELITFATATLVVSSGILFALYLLGECNFIYPKRFKILYKRKK